MDLSGEHWNGINSAERTALAKRLEVHLPTGFRFEGLRVFRMGPTKHEVALFQREDATYSFIPGAEIILGYDVSRGWVPNRDELESWRDSADEYDIDSTPLEYIEEVTLRPRREWFQSFLIETSASEVGWERMASSEPEYGKLVQQYGKNRYIEIFQGQAQIRLQRRDDGEYVVERSLPLRHADLATQVATSGFRFPTSDEWEYVCGGGSETLFRWGDHVPCDRYPVDDPPASAPKREKLPPSGEKSGKDTDTLDGSWNRHRQANSFGLYIASDPYKCELTAEAGVMRGGDGGGSICGGSGFFLGWLPLATAYFDENTCRYDPDEPVMPGYMTARRVLELR